MEAQRAELTEINATLRAQVAMLQQENRLLQQKVHFLLKRMFGRSSESLDRRQLELLLGELESLASPLAQPPKDSPPQPPAPRRAPRDRKPQLPPDAPTEEIIIDPEDVQRDPQGYRQIGQDVTEEFDVIPTQYLRRLIIRRKYVSKADRHAPPILAPLPPRLIPGSVATPGLLTDIMLKKYVDHLPLYRQEQILRTRYGVELSRQTMSEWVRTVADWLTPIYAHIREDLQRGGYLQIDETPVRYCRAEGGGSAQGYFWVYHRPGGDVLYEWHTGRGAECLQDMLAAFTGTVQADGYAVYGRYATARNQHELDAGRPAAIALAGCWAHTRRYVVDAVEEAPRFAGWVLNQIQHLYRVEAEARGCRAGPCLRQALRAARSRMVLRRLEKALKLKMVTYLPKSRMGEAIGYALRHWAQLLRYVENGHLEIDNNLVENAIRPTALGKKNWLFIGHPEAGQRSAVIYTLLECCKRRGINPQVYLHDVLTRLPSMTNQQTRSLTPDNWLAARRTKAA